MKNFTAEDFLPDIIEDKFLINVNITRATLHESKELLNIIDLALLRNFNKVIIALEETEFIDSTFLGALVIAKKKLNKNGGNLILTGLKPDLHSILERTKLLRIFSVFETKEEALEYLKEGELR